MFAIRDQVIPHEAGVAEAINEPAYQAAVGRVCDELNAADRARARYVRGLSARIRRAHTLPEQRLLLLDTVRRTTSRADHALAGLLSLEPPPPLSALQKRTSVTWERNVERLRAYGERLDGASTRGEVGQAIERYARQRAAIERDGVWVTAGLQRLAGAGCKVNRRADTPVVLLPALAARDRRSTAGRPRQRERRAVEPSSHRSQQPSHVTPADQGAGSSGAGGTTGMAPRVPSRDAGPTLIAPPKYPSRDAGPMQSGGGDG